MLLELHVKNLALIEQADVEFQEGLNILTGETGAGKSIIIGSVNLALGQKAPREMIRSGADSAVVELVFFVEEDKREALRALEVYPDEDGMLLLTRKIMPTRSISRINDETVTAARLKAVTGLLLDIHGQHEHQSLLHASRHLEILDLFAKSQVSESKEEVERLYGRYRVLQAALKEAKGDQETRRREADFLRFEIAEIEDAGLREGEEEELCAIYRKYSNNRRIVQGLSAAYGQSDPDLLGQALYQVGELLTYDENLAQIRDQLYDAEAVLRDAHHAIGAYLEETEVDEEELDRLEKRLDQIRGLQAKYGDSVERILDSLEQKKERLDHLEHFEEYQRQTQKEYEQVGEELELACAALSERRREAARELTEQIRAGLADLNFLDVQFSMEFRRTEEYTANGFDEAEFMISANPGEPVRPLGMVASGGELSRIMLAIKTVLADSDEIPTLIFDEIDTGISGRTAQKVSEKLAILSRNHQILCITHLPQIAAMADCHFEISKSADGGSTKTTIRALGAEEMVQELARLLGGAQITDAVLQNAREMKRLAAAVRGKG